MAGRKNLEQSDVAASAEDMLIECIVALWRINSVADTSTAGRRIDDISSRMTQKLHQAGYTIYDKTGQFYDPGMPLRVLTSVEQADLSRPTVVETVSPGVMRGSQILRVGEVVVGTPCAEEDSE